MGHNGMLDYRITYRDDDASSPTFTARVRAYNREHAALKFLDCDDDGWQIVKIARIPPGRGR